MVFCISFHVMGVTMHLGKLYSETFTAGQQIDRLRKLGNQASYKSKDKAQISYKNLLFLTTTLIH